MFEFADLVPAYSEKMKYFLVTFDNISTTLYFITGPNTHSKLDIDFQERQLFVCLGYDGADTAIGFYESLQ